MASTQLYLAHRDERTAAYYLSNDPAKIDTPSLDRALDQMALYFDLRHEPAVAIEALKRWLVRRDSDGKIVEVRAVGRGRPPRGFTIEMLTDEHAQVPLAG